MVVDDEVSGAEVAVEGTWVIRISASLALDAGLLVHESMGETMPGPHPKARRLPRKITTASRAERCGAEVTQAMEPKMIAVWTGGQTRVAARCQKMSRSGVGRVEGYRRRSPPRGRGAGVDVPDREGQGEHPRDRRAPGPTIASGPKREDRPERQSVSEGSVWRSSSRAPCSRFGVQYSAFGAGTLNRPSA